MQSIEIYLEKFKDFGLKEKLLKEKILEIIKQETKGELSEDNITIQNGVIRINVSGVLKSEIFIKRKIIKDRLNKNLEIL